MYFEDLSMRNSINCASAHQNGGFCSSEKIELAASLVNGININVQSITLHLIVLVFELRVNIAFVN